MPQKWDKQKDETKVKKETQIESIPNDETNVPNNESNVPNEEKNKPNDETNKSDDETNKPNYETNIPNDETKVEARMIWKVRLFREEKSKKGSLSS